MSKFCKNGESVNKKFGFTGEVRRYEGHFLRQIYAISAFGDVKKNEVGGWIQRAENLSEDGLCWVHPDGMVAQHAVVKDDAQVHSGIVYESAIVEGQATIGDNRFGQQFPRVCGNARISDKARIRDMAAISGFAKVQDRASVLNYAIIRDDVTLKDMACVFHHAIVFGCATLRDHAFACEHSMIGGTVVLYDHCAVSAHTTLLEEGAYAHVHNKKYMIDWGDRIEKDSHSLFRIIALQDGAFFHNGERGGYVESEFNLSHAGHAWIQEGAWAYGDTVIQCDNLLRAIDCED